MQGIYCIRNISDQSCYIGSSSSVLKRVQSHFSHLKRNAHINPYFQNAYNKYKTDNFDWVILEEVTDQKDLVKREQHYIDIAPAEETNLYNLSLLATGSIGLRKSKETRNKIRRALKTRNVLPPSRKNLGYGYCKLYCPKGHYKTTASLISKTGSCKECQRLKSREWRTSH